MKTRIHRWMLGIMILLLMPGTLVACLGLIGVVGESTQLGFRTSSAVATNSPYFQMRSGSSDQWF